MAYYNSNEPYNRVDSVGDGFMTGAALGAGAVAGAQFGGGALLNKQRAAVQDEFTRKMGNAQAKVASGDMSAADYNKIRVGRQGIGQAKLDEINNGKMNKAHSKVFGGGWKGKAAGYGAGVLAGGLAGAGVDAMN